MLMSDLIYIKKDISNFKLYYRVAFFSVDCMIVLLSLFILIMLNVISWCKMLTVTQSISIYS